MGATLKEVCGALPACLWAGISPLPGVSAGPGSGCSFRSKAGVGVPAAGCQLGCVVSLQTDAGSGSPGKRLPPIGYAAQLQLAEKLARPSLPLCRAKSGWHLAGVILPWMGMYHGGLSLDLTQER